MGTSVGVIVLGVSILPPPELGFSMGLAVVGMVGLPAPLSPPPTKSTKSPVGVDGVPECSPLHCSFSVSPGASVGGVSPLFSSFT